MDVIGYIKENIGKTAGVGLGGLGGIAFLAKDAIKEWWVDRHAEKKAELDEKKLQHGFGDKLANELLEILREDLRDNKTLLKDLVVTMNEFRDIIRIQKDQGTEMMTLAKETRESQKWIERNFGRSPQA